MEPVDGQVPGRVDRPAQELVDRPLVVDEVALGHVVDGERPLEMRAEEDPQWGWFAAEPRAGWP